MIQLLDCESIEADLDIVGSHRVEDPEKTRSPRDTMEIGTMSLSCGLENCGCVEYKGS